MKSYMELVKEIDFMKVVVINDFVDGFVMVKDV